VKPRQRTPWSVLFHLSLAVTLALGVLIVAPSVNSASASGTTYTVTQGCPYGGTLDASGNCTSSTPAGTVTTLGCPNGGTLDASGNCDVPASTTAAVFTTGTTYTCPSGSAQSGSGVQTVCTVTTETPVTSTIYASLITTTSTTSSCPSGYSQSTSFDLANGVCSTSTTPTSYANLTTTTTTSSTCPSGYSQSTSFDLTNGVCSTTTTTYSTTTSYVMFITTTTSGYSCPTGVTPDANNNCVTVASSYPAVEIPTCAPNTTLSGSNCVLSYPEQWIASEVICATTYSGTGSTQSEAISSLTGKLTGVQGVCVVSGTTYEYSAYAGTYSGANACDYWYNSDVSQSAADALALTAAQTLCAGQTVATSNPVTVAYKDPCTGLIYLATAQATEPGGGAAAAGSSAYNAAKAVAMTTAENEAIAAEEASNHGVQGCGAIRTANYSTVPVSGEVPVSSTMYRSGNGSSGAVTYNVCSPNGTIVAVTNNFTATYPVSGQGAQGTATVYSPNDPTDIAAAQLVANTEAAAAAVTEAITLATAAANQAASNAEALAAANCAILGSSTPTTTTTTSSSGTPTTTTTTPGGTQSGGGVSTGGIDGGGTLDAIDCPTSAMCVAVGYNTNYQSIWTMGTLSGTVWSWTPEATIPSDSTGQGLLLAIGCPTSTTCIATGGSAGGSTGLGVTTTGTLTNGTWSWTREVDLTSDANGGGVLFSMSCVSSTECVAGGDDHKWRGVATSVNLVNGTWKWDAEVMVGSDANGGGRLLAMSCPSATECVAVGNDDPGASNFTIGTKSGGTWSWSANKVIQPDNTGVGELDGVACPTTTLCIAVGYDNAQQGIQSIGTLVGGNWTWTTESQVYIGAVPMGDFAGITCSSSAICSTVGYDGLSQGQAAGLEVLAGVPGWTDQLTITSPATGGGRLLAISSTGVGSYVSVGNTAVGIVIGT